MRHKPAQASRPCSKDSSDTTEHHPESNKGRPRDKNVHRAILECALHQARTKPKYKDITIEELANEAKVAKTTIYRWWASKAELLNEACFDNQLQDADMGSLNGELRKLVAQAYDLHTQRASRGVFAGLLAEYIEFSAENPEIQKKKICPHERDIVNILTIIYGRAKERGEGPDNPNIQAITRTIESTLFHDCITYGITPTDHDLEVLMERIATAAMQPKVA